QPRALARRARLPATHRDRDGVPSEPAPAEAGCVRNESLRNPVRFTIVVHVRSDLGIQWCEMSEWDCTSTAVTGPLIRAQLQLIIQMLGSSERPDCCGEVMSELNLARDL